MDWDYEEADEFDEQEEEPDVEDDDYQNFYNGESTEEYEEPYQNEEESLQMLKEYRMQELNARLQQLLGQFTQKRQQNINLFSPARLSSSVKNDRHKHHILELQKESNMQYYKRQFKINQQIRQIFPFQTKVQLKELFLLLARQFKMSGYNLCEIKLITYYNRKQRPDKLTYEGKTQKIQKEVKTIIKRCCYNEDVKFQQQDELQSFLCYDARYRSYIHFILKLPFRNRQQVVKAIRQLKLFITERNMTNPLKIIDPKIGREDYLSVNNNSRCASVEYWNIGCITRTKQSEGQKTKQKIYTYYQSKDDCWISFSRSFNRDSQIKEIIFYCRFKGGFVLRIVIKKEQIYLLNLDKQKQQVYIFLSSPPIYQFSITQANSYCLPNYLRSWERIENFIFLKHRELQNNDFLRLYLYSNSFIHFRLNRNDKQQSNSIVKDIEILQQELKCKLQRFTAAKIDDQKQLFALFDPSKIQSALSFFYIRERPFMTSNLIWKLSYQILLLIRFNVVGPSEIQDFLSFCELNQESIEEILQITSQISSSYTNKTAVRNLSRKQPYINYKKKVFKELFKRGNIHQQLGQKSRSKKDEASVALYKVALTPSGILPQPRTNQSKNRLIRHFEGQSDFFLKVTLMDDAGENLKNKKYLYDKILRVLLDSVKIKGRSYVPLGWSGSQLRSSSLWYVSEVHSNQAPFFQMTQKSILQFLGNFEDIRIAAKKAARIGQAFSSSYSFDSSNLSYKIIEDDKSVKKFLFTDGIGQISREAFEDVKKWLESIGIRDVNCCLQMRYRGAKGVLLVNEQLKGKQMILRKSMVKYPCESPSAAKYLDIVGWDKYLPGYLNRQIIILLRSLEVPDEAFLSFQKKYIQQLNNLSYDDLEANFFRVLGEAEEGEDSFALTVSSLKNHINLSKDLFFQEFLQSIRDSKFEELKKRSRILVEKSARLIGVIDDYEILRQDELFCSIVKNKGGKVENIQGDVIITRNPSLSPADVRCCRCLSLAEVEERFKTKTSQLFHLNRAKSIFSSFTNCIVFPKAGAIPLTSQISGSDLDGDLFFICWDRQLYVRKPKPIETLDDPNKQSPIIYTRPGYKQMLDFFVNFSDCQKLGRINNTHLITADKSPQFANDPECKLLADLHGKAVDYAKSGDPPKDIPHNLRIRVYPDFMQKWNMPQYKSQSVLGKLYVECREAIKQRRQNIDRNNQYCGLNEKLLQELSQARINQGLIQSVYRQLSTFEANIQELIAFCGLKNQFQLYSGTSSESQELKNDFGRRRVAGIITKFKNIHLNIFFNGNHKEIEVYKRMSLAKLKNSNAFSKQVRTKAALAYLITYYCKSNAKSRNRFQIRSKVLKDEIERLRNNYEGRFLGFVWLVIPKIIIKILQEH